MSVKSEIAGLPIVILQVDPGVKEFSLFTLTLSGGKELGMVLVAKTDHGSYVAGTEYWSLTQSGLNSVGEATTLTWNGTSYDWRDLSGTAWPGDNPLPMFSMPASVTWNEANAPTNVFATNATNNVTLDFLLNYERETWGGSLVWSQTGTSQYVIPVGQTVMTSTAAPAGSNWTSATVLPTQIS